MNTAIPPLSGDNSPGNEGKIQEKAREFSGIFYSTLFKVMDESTESFGGHGEDLMRSFKADAFGRAIAGSESGNALTEIISNALAKREEATKRTPVQIAQKIRTLTGKNP